MKDCPFCIESYEKFVKKDQILYENAKAYSILSITPVTPGQAIIIPINHITHFEDVDKDTDWDISSVISGTKKVILDRFYSSKTGIEELVEFYHGLKQNPPISKSKSAGEEMLKRASLYEVPVAFNVGYNDGRHAGQIIDHIHKHLFPRRISDHENGIVTAMGMMFR